MRFRLLLLGLLLWGSSALVSGSNEDLARNLVEQLYAPQGIAPIRDMVIELEDHAAGGGSSNLVCRARTKVFYKFPNRLRVDQVHVAPKSPNDGKLTVVIRDGENLWVYAGNQLPAKKGTDTSIPTLAIPFNIQRYRRDSEREFFSLGQETLDGETVQRVQIVNPAIPDWTAVLWIDPARRVPLQLETSFPAAEKEKAKKKKVLYREIKKLPDGRYFPFQIHIFEDDVLKEVKIYKGVRVNVGLEDTLFEPMKEFLKGG